MGDEKTGWIKDTPKPWKIGELDFHLHRIFSENAESEIWVSNQWENSLESAVQSEQLLNGRRSGGGGVGNAQRSLKHCCELLL